MSTQYRANVYAPKLPMNELVLRSHHVLTRLGLRLDEESDVWVDDEELEEPVPQCKAKSVQVAIEHMSKWESPSALEYELSSVPNDPENRCTGYVVSVFFYPNLDLSVVALGFAGSAFDADHYPDTVPLIVAVTEALHHELGALRSSFDWGLYDAVSEPEEARALSEGHVEARPSQWLDIVDKSLVNPAIVDVYQREVKPGSVLRKTADGGLFWQRDAGPP